MAETVSDSWKFSTHGVALTMEFEASCTTVHSSQIGIKTIDIESDQLQCLERRESICNKMPIQEGNNEEYVNMEYFKPALISLNQSLNSNIEDKISNTIRPESKAVVDDLLEKIKKLSILQKLLLYNKFPSIKDSEGEVDPLRRPLNPLGNRNEVSQALVYIKTHFLPDADISLPKKEIYNEYVTYCLERNIKPLSTADFGKAMKQVYPVVRPRRLGERGNSRYCYSGLSNRDKLNKPSTPGFPVGQVRDNITRNICCWASQILNVQIDSLSDLNNIITSDFKSDVGVSRNTHFQKKAVDRKRKSEVEKTEHRPTKSAKQKNIDKQRKCQTSNPPSTNCFKWSIDVLSRSGKHKAAFKAAKSDKSCDNIYQTQNTVDASKVDSLCSIHLQSDKSPNLQKTFKYVSGEDSVSRQSDKSKNSGVSTLKESDCLEQIVAREDSFSIASIEEGSTLDERYRVNLTDAKNGKDEYFCNNNVIGDKKSDLSVDIADHISVDNSLALSSEQAEVLSNVDCERTDGHGLIFQDEGNSQEPEEELLKYFKNSIQSNVSIKKSVSELRHLLKQDFNQSTNLKCSSSLSKHDSSCPLGKHSGTKQSSITNYTLELQQKRLSTPKETSPSNINTNNSRRRVSFENNSDCFLPSPNIHKTNFIFTPISPRPSTISKSNGPFVYPRETIFRGKVSSIPQNPTPILILPGSTQTNVSRSTPVSSTPSPSVNSHSFSNSSGRGRSTPQEVNQEYMESNKSSPLISPSSSGVFLSPSSPISSCNSPVFSFRKSLSPIRHADDLRSVKSHSSLLHTLLVTNKGSEEKTIYVRDDKDYLNPDDNNQKKMNCLELNLKQSSYSNSVSQVRSRSVPTLKNSEAISPISNRVPFPFPLTNEDGSLIDEIKNNELDVLDSVLDELKQTIYTDNLLIENMSDNDTVESGINMIESEVSMQSVISNLCEFLVDKGLQSTDTNVKPLNVSSNPNTLLVYNQHSDLFRDPVVSAFPLTTAPKSYPSIPIVSLSQNSSNETTPHSYLAKRNIIPLLDSLSSPVPSLSEDLELNLNNLAGLSTSDDAFYELAREVTSSNYKEMQ